MYTRAISYEDLDGQVVEHVYSFHLTKAEAVEMNFSRKGGVEAYARKIVDTKEHGELVELFKDLILKTYGIRDGMRFTKSPEITAEFVETGAYSELFIELATNADEAIKFFKGIFPKDMQGRVEEAVGAESKDFTDQELMTMSWDDFYRAAGGKDDKNWEKRYFMLAYRRKSSLQPA
jgi:hypothetical protein